MNNILLIGPYIGDWKQEIFTFRPYAKWIYEQLNYPKCYISSHFNRYFLYDWIPKENFIPVFEQLTRNEAGQNNYIHNDINHKDYKILVKNFEKNIKEKENISTKNISLYNLSYLKSTPHYSWFQKIFTKIKLEPIKNDYIIYIPDKSINKKFNDEIYKNLKKEYNNIVMVGDNNCYNLKECLNYQINYIETGFELIIKYIMGCKFVITPCSHWTFLCNLQNIPVFSWGDECNIYKKESDYGFNNNNYILISNDINKILKAIKYFYKKECLK
jgi:hypothetical protein